ncbi:uncharacterized protein LOC116619278 [Nematostella vectensis]|uniref:uncharacterized protein LOC116619278 n=1 Tax=Nematostella vectensis TaxID=45351 RepID=UPI00138FD52F|nr:uncharacterized protein LOC116619278 [Nematostella vectensis]
MSALRSFVLISIVLLCNKTSFSLGLLRDKEFRNFQVLLLPFGVNLTSPSERLSIPTNEWQTEQNTTESCGEHFKELEACNATSWYLIGNTTSSEHDSLNKLFIECQQGRFTCIQMVVAKSLALQTWIGKLKNTLHSLCWDQCWNVLLHVQQNCYPNEKLSEQPSLLFALQALNAYCSEPGEPVGDEVTYCTDLFTQAALSPPSHPDEPCDSKMSTKRRSCSADCHREISSFYGSMGTCVGSVSSVMDQSRVHPSKGSFGQLVHNSYKWCGKTQPKDPKKDINPASKVTTKPQVMFIPSNKGSSSLGDKVIAAIVVGTIVACIAVAIMARCAHKRLASPKLTLEDYGYSRLQINEDLHGYYYNVEDDDERLLAF